MHYLSFVVIAFAAGVQLAGAQSDGQWSTAAGGSWANAGNWLDGTIAAGTDNTALFGFSLYPVNASATFTLDGAQTIGNLVFTAQTTPANWVLKAGTGGTLTLDTSFDYPAVTLNPAALQVTVSAVVAGTAGLEKFGAGTLILTATNPCSGGTIVSGGTLLVNGRMTAPDAVTVSSGTLGGTGIISGPVTVQSGGTLSVSAVAETLTVSNSLVLQTGSKTVVAVNASTLAHSLITGISAASYGGTLTVSNLAGTPAIGQSFAVFGAASFTGDFSGITPQLSGNARWEFNPAQGTLSVVGTNLQPYLAIALLGKSNVLLAVTHGVPGATNYLLAATNLNLPRAGWLRAATNVFDAGGNLTVTNAVNSTASQRFFQISTAP